MIKKHYKKLVILSILMMLMLATTLPALGAPEKARVFVEFAPGAKGKVEQALKNEGAQFHYTFDDLNSFVVSVPEEALKGLEHNPNVVSIEEDVPRYLVKSTVAEAAVETAALWSDATDYDGAEILPWGVQAVQAPLAWDAATPATGAGVTVCIIDTGYYEDHEDLPLSVGGMAQLDAPYTVDGAGHGSHVAGTIGAIDNQVGVIGVSPDVSFYIVKFFGNDGAATSASDLIAAANDCGANGADIISMSLGGGRSSRQEQRAFDNLYAAGVLSIAAASNEGTSALSYPASYGSVVSVAALDANEVVADFSNFNTAVEVAAPGVGVLSTIPYIESSFVSVDGTDYQANHIEFSGYGTASGALVNGGLCDAIGSWSGKVVLCERGVISFADKVLNVASGGGAAALIYNNEAGNFLGTMDTASSDMIGLSLSQEDGQYLVANKLGETANVSSIFQWPASGYEAWDGTSMATPHVSAVAALLWSVNPAATNVEIREAMTATAKDLGDAGRDVYYGYGLVQAYDALVYLGGGTTNTPPVVTITAPADGAGFDEGSLVTFSGSAYDTEDGNLSASIAWTSDLDGSLGTGAEVSSLLSVGTHTITASVNDSGSLTGSDSITVTVSGSTANTPPAVTITAPADGAGFDEGSLVTFSGSAYDTEDGNLSANIAWTSDLDGSLGTGANVSSSLSVGTHTITASVTDSGSLTSSDSITVTVNSGGSGSELFVAVATDQAVYGDRQWVTMTVTVTDGSTPLANASVTGTLVTATGNVKTFTGLTGTDGTVNFLYKTFVRKDGTGTYTVNAVATLSGYTDGVGSTTFLVQ